MELIDKYKLEKAKDRIILYLLSLYYNLNYHPDLFDIELKILYQNKIIEKDYIKNINILKIDLFKVEAEDFIQTYRSLFKGIKIGAMGSLNGVTKKMKKFLKDNKYTEDEIIRATEFYIKNTENKYIRQADYFIEKNGESTLSSILEEGFEDSSQKFNFITNA